MVEIGKKYQHFKGKEYLVEGVAKHSETLEPMIIYRALYGEGDLWVRPLSMFEENVTFEGKTMPRFCLMEDDQ